MIDFDVEYDVDLIDDDDDDNVEGGKIDVEDVVEDVDVKLDFLMMFLELKRCKIVLECFESLF